MCSVDADDIDDLEQEDGHLCKQLPTTDLEHELETKITLKEPECNKCGVPAVVVLRINDAYCISCLQSSVCHKFRSCLGKSHMMKHGEKVLICFSGGPSSVAMLHLIKQGLDETSHKKLRLTPYVLHIDESAVLDINDAENYRKELQEIVSIVKTYEFPLYATSIEMVMRNPGDIEFQLITTNDISMNIKSDDILTRTHGLFNSIKSLTSKEDLLTKLRQKLSCSIARQLDCSKVFVADSETRIAVRVLSDIAQGKGRHLPFTCGFVDDRFTDVLIVRPMREILIKEISHFVKSFQLKTVVRPTLTTKHDSSDSIQHLTEKFVFGLQSQFPSTVSTIFRTGDKMAKKSGLRTSENPNNSCILCMASLDINAPEKQKEKMTKTACRSNCSCSTSLKQLDRANLRCLLCYSCRIIVDETPCIEDLPPFVLDSATSRLNRFKMKSEIQEYLLEDSDNGNGD